MTLSQFNWKLFAARVLVANLGFAAGVLLSIPVALAADFIDASRESVAWTVGIAGLVLLGLLHFRWRRNARDATLSWWSLLVVLVLVVVLYLAIGILSAIQRARYQNFRPQPPTEQS